MSIFQRFVSRSIIEMSINRRKTTKRVRLGELTDEEIQQFMDFTGSDEENEDFSSDDDFNDTNYGPDNISPEDDQAIDKYLMELKTSNMCIAQAVHLSLNLSSLGLSPADIDDIGAEETISTETENSSEPGPSTSNEPTTSNSPSTSTQTHKSSWTKWACNTCIRATK